MTKLTQTEMTAILMREAVALLLLATWLMVGASLYSFDASDPSLNQTSHQMPHNLLGYLGSYLSDFIYQMFGLGSWFLLMLGMLCAWRIAWGKRPYLGSWTSLFWLPVMLSCLGLLYLHDPSTTDLPAGLGGALGVLLGQYLLKYLSLWGAHGVLIAVLLSGFVVASRISVLSMLHRAGWMVLCGGKGLKNRLQQRQTQKKTDALAQENILEVQAEPETLLPIIEKIEPTVVDSPTLLDEMTDEVLQKAAAPSASNEHDQEHHLEIRKQTEIVPSKPSSATLGIGDSPFELPSLQFFPEITQEKYRYSPETLQKMGHLLEQKLLEYRVEGRVVAVQPGPVVVQFELELAAGTKSSKVVGLQSDLARSMAAYSVRVVGNIPGKNVIGIELPNAKREMVGLREVLASQKFSLKKQMLPLALGVDIAGKPVVVDLAKMPHLLVAGTTGSGKSVAVNAMICSMLMTHTPETLRLIMVDPKMLELSMYDDIPHLLVPVVTSPHKANKALAWAVFEMERRYKMLSEAKVRNLAGYNAAVKVAGDGEILPLIVIVIDELADLMMVSGKEVEQSICRLAQKARAAGLHLILATQRPSVDVITGLIKANLPSRLACKVSSKIDSRTILDQMGAEQLLGMGDSLFLNGGGDLQRVHGAFVSDQSVIDVVTHLKTQGEPDYRDEVFNISLDDVDEDDAMGGMQEERDARYDEAAALVIEKSKCSVSMVQRYLRVGYNRASRIVEQMEQDGLVTPPGVGGQRKVLARSDGGVME